MRGESVLELVLEVGMSRRTAILAALAVAACGLAFVVAYTPCAMPPSWLSWETQHACGNPGPPVYLQRDLLRG